MQIIQWITAHAVLVTSTLSAIVVVDHALAATDLVKSSSTGQAVLATIDKVLSAILSLMKAPPAA